MSNDTESLDMTETQSVPDGEARSPSAPASRSFRSFKRKYGKQKIRFELAMREGSGLVREEMRIQDLSKRLREQNDQLLELLLELNSTVHIPRSLRYGLTTYEDMQLHTTISEPTEYIPVIECDAHTAGAKLSDAKQKLLAGEMTADECRELELSMLKSSTFSPVTDITALLESVPHTSLLMDDVPDSDIESTLGFIYPEDDTEYPVPGSIPRLDFGNVRASCKHLTPADREKAAIIRNPSSVYNWLRKNKPQVFAHDSEAPPVGAGSTSAPGNTQADKPAAAPRPSATRTSKRASTQVHRDDEIYDEDGMIIDGTELPAVGPAHGTGGGARAKRKRDEDGVYHPKGGNRGRKKRDDKRTKRPSTASAAA